MKCDVDIRKDLRQHRAVWWHHHVPRHRRPYAEGNHGAGPVHHEDQDHRAPRAQIFGLDRWFHPGLSVHLPADVDLETGVRRIRPIHCAQEMLLKGQRLTSPTDDASCGLWRFLPIARLLIPSPSATATYTEISNSTSPSPALQHSKTGVALLLLLFLCRSSVTMAYF